MKNMMILSLLLALPCVAWPDGRDVDALVESVRQEALKEAEHDEQRIDRFLADQEQQQELLADAKAQLAAATARANRLRDAYEENEQTLTEYEAILVERAGDLNDLFAIVRQSALSADNVLESSLVSAEQSQRSSFLQDIGKGETSPTIDDIKRLWTTVLTEISESGKVVRFNATLIKPQGDEVQQVVTRAGVFTSVSDGAFLRYLPGSGKLVELSRQPAMRFQRMAQNLQDAESGMVAMALDPSKGAILSLMVQSPDFRERIRQGGSIGYLILVLGAIGVIIVIRGAISLLIAGRRIDKQAINKEASDNNGLGRLKLIAVSDKNESMTSLGIRLDEALAEEAARLSRGLATVAVLAAVSPLLGLLGTVTGMIETFQSITLFGTGDPKLMSGGISQALVTTQLGLSVAIPLVLFHSLLTGRANRLVERLGKYSSDLLTNNELD